MDYLQVLRDFDQVYVANPALVHELPRQLGIRAPKYLYMGVDALKMSPLPVMPERVVDVYSYGRRAAVTHSALLDLVEQKGLMYVYDSLQDGRLQDHREHRSLLANMMKRSRFFLAHRINDSPRRQGRTGGDESPSTRFYEGAAGGAVLLGSRPQTPEFDADFPWDDAVVPFPWDSAEIGDAIADLERQPERLARIRAANVAGSLRTHDWAYRWGEILRDVDLSPLAGTDTRLEALAAMAGDVTPELFLDTRRRS
jgi:hypothetical protein